MVNTADTHENSDEFSLRVCFPSGLVGLKEVHMPVPILISGAYALIMHPGEASSTSAQLVASKL